MPAGADKIQVILASRSADRRELLREFFPDLIVREANVDESPRPGEPVPDLVLRLAKAKGLVVAADCAGALVISADTLLSHEGRPLGKASGRDAAAQMLRGLSGREFMVYTATCLSRPDAGIVASKVSQARLWMREWNEFDLGNYLESGVWAKRAGAISIASPDCPARILEGKMDVVRGLDVEFVRHNITA